MSEQTPSGPAIKELSGQIGKYSIIRPVGKGAMGMVYLAKDNMLDRDVALKVMVAQIADDPELKQRFEREAKTVAKLTHPNVVMVFDFGYHTDGSPYIAMELLKGLDLQKAMRQPPPMTLERKVAIIIQVLSGLGHAHQAGIVHRDIKPANVFINADGNVKIMDFGVARLTTASMTGTGNIVGTADYMSPEQVKGAKVDGRSDLFSVGCLLYELLAGRRPFHSENLMAIFYKITHEEPNFDLIPAGEEYESLLPILRKALHKDLRQRYQRGYDFAVDLREWLKGHATTGGHVLESLGELEAPAHTGAPMPMTSAPGATVMPSAPGELAPGTVDLTAGRRAPTAAGRTLGATARVGAAGTVAGTRAGAPTGAGTMRPGPTQYMPAAGSTVLRPTRPEREGGHPMLWVVVGGLSVALAVAGGWIYWSQSNAGSSDASVTQLDTPPSHVPAPSVTEAPPPTPEAAASVAPPTPAPVPTFEAKGRAMKAAQAAFSAGNYDRALASAQEALREDPGNPDAQKLAENALSGQKAEARLRTAESALRQGDYDRATSEAEAARDIAPWDGRITSFISRVRDAQIREQQTQAQQRQTAALTAVNATLAKADEALTQQKYDAALGLYDEVLKVDPNNQRATLGRTSALGARAVAQAGQGTRPAGRGFVVGKTVAQGAENTAGNVPPGFEDSAGVTVKKGTQLAELPGKVNFEFSPEVVKPGERYSVSVSLVNEGSAPIQIKTMHISTTINGKRAAGAVPPLAKEVAPKQKTLLYSLTGEIWKEDTTSWSMEVTVATARGETYKNQLTWK